MFVRVAETADPVVDKPGFDTPVSLIMFFKDGKPVMIDPGAFYISGTQEKITFLGIERNQSDRGDADLVFHKLIDLRAITDCSFDMAG